MFDQRLDSIEHPTTRTAAAPVSADLSLGLPDRWTVEEFLGAGGQAEVWRAFDRELREVVALRVLYAAATPAGLERMRRELRLGHTLRHPCLVGVHELIALGGRFAVVMDWMPGGSLSHRLERVGMLPIVEVLDVAERTLMALAHLHAEGVLHRDVKPSNLLLDGEGKARLSDLGLARPVEHGQTVTETARVVGSAGYMSPEQLRGQDLTPASDLYSLGATLYHLTTGEPAFVADSGVALAIAHVARPAPDPRKSRRDCPGWLARFILRLLEKNPADRFPDAAEALEAFRRRRWPSSRRATRNRLLAAGVFLGALGGAFAVLRTARGAWDHVATVQAEGHVVRAVAASGRVMWTRGFDAPVTQVERADLDGDGEVETAVAVVPASGFDERTRDPQHSEILILDASGAVRDRFQPDKTVNRYESHPIVPPLFIPRLFLADLDGDRHPDLVVNCRHRTLGLAALFGYWGKTRRWELLLNHPGGWIFHLAAVPGAEPPRLRFLAFNSLIGSHAVLGEIAVGQPPEASIGGTNALVGASAGAALAWYTPLDPSVAMLPADDQPGFGVDALGASTFSLRGVPLMVDRFGNPTPGPNSGRDLRLARVGFMQAMGELAQGTRSFANAGLALAERQHLRTEFSQLMLEPAHRSILDLEISRCLDRAGAIQEAVALLRERSAELRYDGLGYWLAHTQALAGDLDGAVKTAEATIANANTSVGTFLAPRLLLRLAIERRDAALFRRILPIFMRGQPPEILAAVEARAHLWWDEADGGDCRVRSFDLVPDGEPIACLARWRLGRTTPDDPDRMQAAIKTSPDAEIECLIARAMALLARGEPAGALLALDRAEAALSTAGRNRWDFTWMQNEQLVRACRVGALVAAGRREEATRLVRELRPTLRRGLLPARLVDDAVRDLAAVRNAAVLRQAH